MSSVVDAIIKQAENAAPKSEKLDGKEKLSKQFIPRLESGQKSNIYNVRILPGIDGASPFIEAYFYNIKIGKQYKKIYSIGKNDGGEDLILGAYDILRAGDEVEKKMAAKYSPRKFWICRVIERGKESEGPKYWRFAHNYKGLGIFDKLLPLFKKFGDITDLEIGRDLEITVGKDSNNYDVVNAILPNDPSVLHPDQGFIDAVVAAGKEITWRDVFYKAKEATKEFQEQVLQDRVPYWDEGLKQYVTPGQAVIAQRPATVQNESYTDSTSANTLINALEDQVKGVTTPTVATAPVEEKPKYNFGATKKEPEATKAPVITSASLEASDDEDDELPF